MPDALWNIIPVVAVGLFLAGYALIRWGKIL